MLWSQWGCRWPHELGPFTIPHLLFGTGLAGLAADFVTVELFLLKELGLLVGINNLSGTEERALTVLSSDTTLREDAPDVALGTNTAFHLFLSQLSRTLTISLTPELHLQTLKVLVNTTSKDTLSPLDTVDVHAAFSIETTHLGFVGVLHETQLAVRLPLVTRMNTGVSDHLLERVTLGRHVPLQLLLVTAIPTFSVLLLILVALHPLHRCRTKSGGPVLLDFQSLLLRCVELLTTTSRVTTTTKHRVVLLRLNGGVYVALTTTLVVLVLSLKAFLLRFLSNKLGFDGCDKHLDDSCAPTTLGVGYGYE